MAKVRTTEPPAAGTTAVPLVLVMPLLTVSESAPLPQAAAIPPTVTETTFVPESERTTLRPSESQAATVARPLASVWEPNERLVANPNEMAAAIVTITAAIPINQGFMGMGLVERL